MPHALEGCLAKIQRADESIRNLDVEITTLLSNKDAYRIVGEQQHVRGRYVFKAYGMPIPLRFSVLAGEIIHHLRSSLDYVVWAFARQSGINPSQDIHIQFPICETKEKFERAAKRGILKGVPRTIHPLIESTQPYRTPRPEDSSLLVLHQMEITEKHQLLLVVTNVVTMAKQLTLSSELPWNITGLGPPPKNATATEDGTEVFWLSYTAESDPKPQVKGDFAIQVAFSRFGRLECVQVIPGLTHLRDVVAQTVNIFMDCF